MATVIIPALAFRENREFSHRPILLLGPVNQASPAAMESIVLVGTVISNTRQVGKVAVAKVV